jgi:GTP cyclohydrolase I
MNEVAKRNITWNSVRSLAINVAHEIIADSTRLTREVQCYPVPRGGIFAALAVQNAMVMCYPDVKFIITSEPKEADIYVDDIVDSGATKSKILRVHGNKPFYSLAPKSPGVWIVFPWEQMSNETGPEDNITRMLQYIGEDPAREGLVETPSRVIKAYDELFAGYKIDIPKLIKTFEDKESICDEMVISKDIEFYSMCEHHMLPFFGKAHVAYIPDKSIIGLSKLARVVDAFSKRLQVQEKLTTQITKALDDHLKPKGSACVIEARHLCCMARGVGKQNSTMKTSSLTGVFREPAVRSEFFSLIS